MPILASLINIGVDAMVADVVSVSLHSADPGTTGANEVTGTGYARQVPTWGPAEGGTATTTAPMTFQVGAGNEVTHYGTWGADGTFHGGKPVTVPGNFIGDGEYKLNSISLPCTAVADA